MRSVDDEIRKAIEAGKFDNLPGKGQPLRLEDNPHEDPEWRLARHVLRNAGYTLPWIEQRQELESEIEKVRRELRQVWQPMVSPAGRRQVQEDFREQVARLNGRIRAYNLIAPSEHFHMRLLDAQAELHALTA